MKVKVSYTINIEEIPNKVKELIEKNAKILDSIVELSAEATRGDLGAKSLENISKMKQMSSDMTETFADCESILSGFLSAMFTPEQVEGENNNDDNT